MDSGEIRRLFLEFFEKKGHQIVPSAPLVLKNDPTLLFTNSGMVQFKDYFLGNATPKSNRIADTQKCLRVSGKHNDLEEVGIDTYHHTMFEMLGNWSFGDYFKKEAIEWAWELLTEVYKLPKDRLYVSVFGGDKTDNLPMDEEARKLWLTFVEKDRIILGKKKDNFWEMGETGPCGPCSEIHIDLRSAEEIKKTPGKELVNNDHPQVIEIWNLVFMEFNRKADSSLEKLPAQHVDTGMGFERLCMAIQGKTSNYDTDVFSPLINFIAEAAGVKYKQDEKIDIALRVMADHVRAVSFAVCDGQLPSNTGAGYVIRRILRRAVRYGFTFLNFKEPFLYKLVAVLSNQLKNVFPELESQKDYVAKVVFEEEKSFLKTLEAGIFAFEHFLVRKTREALGEFFKEKSIKYKSVLSPTRGTDFYFPDDNFCLNIVLSESRFNVINQDVQIGDNVVKHLPVINVHPREVIKDEFWKRDLIFVLGIDSFEFKNKLVDGNIAFILNDTHGFPIDLTQLMAREVGLMVDMVEFEKLLNEQRSRSKADATKQTGDWVTYWSSEKDYEGFIGYDYTEFGDFKSDDIKDQIAVLKSRNVKQKGRDVYQVVLTKTPFYAESGGQVGDTGYLESSVGERIKVVDTKKENELIIHILEKEPTEGEFLTRSIKAVVDLGRRRLIMNNHSVTHLLHAALRDVLGKHVEQKGSLVNEKITRFDFSHFAAMTADEIQKVEDIVNRKIRENIQLDEKRNVPIADAKKFGAMALFGEKYGDYVRVITFDPKFSVELCGGTHVKATGNIGLFKILSESSVAAGVRRVEAVTADEAEKYIKDNFNLLDQVRDLLKNPKDLIATTKNLLEEKHALERKLEAVNLEKANLLKDDLAKKVKSANGISLIIEKVSVPNADALKNITYALRNQFDDLLLVLAAEVEGKPQVSVMIGEKLAATNKFHAGNMVKELAKEIDGGGGGQPFFATAGGKNLNGLDAVIEKAKKMIG